MSDRCLVLVPIRSFADPKTRLSSVLDAEERKRLARDLAAGVFDALDGWAPAAVTDDEEVISWAHQLDVTVIAPGVGGLNAAVTAGAEHAQRLGATQVGVVHADLALPDQLDAVLREAVDADARARVRAIPDRHSDGTNVLVVPAGGSFRYSYGPGSFHRHRAEAERLGLGFNGTAVESLGWDIDTPDDLREHLTRQQRSRPRQE